MATQPSRSNDPYMTLTPPLPPRDTSSPLLIHDTAIIAAPQMRLCPVVLVISFGTMPACSARHELYAFSHHIVTILQWGVSW